MTLQYPTSFQSIRSWAAANDAPVDEARKRFAQYAVLVGIASSRTLGHALVFKGGNALDFIWQPNRSTTDLDFSVDANAITDSFDEHTIRNALRQGLNAAGIVLSIAFSVHKVVQQPPGPNRTFITYEAAVGYALEDEERLRVRMERGQPSINVIPVEISINEPICDERTIALDATHRIRVSTVEDIVAEKLRALLQQPIRNRTRRQDLLDIAVVLHEKPDLDPVKVAEYLLRKAKARNVPISRAAFRNPEIAARAGQDYALLEVTTRKDFIPFHEALRVLNRFVDALQIQEDV